MSHWKALAISAGVAAVVVIAFAKVQTLKNFLNGTTTS